MALIPPAPVGGQFGSYTWQDWYEKVRRAINTAANISWSQITDFTGSSLANLATRNHSDLQNVLPALATGHVPLGGTTNQVLTKSSNTNLDYAWAAGGGGGGITALTGDVTASGSGSVAASFDLGLNHAWTANQRVANSTLTDAGTVSVNALLGNNFYLLTTSAVGGTRAIGALSNGQPGMFIGFEIKQPATGGPCAVTWDSSYVWGVDGTGSAPATSTTASTVSYFAGYVRTDGKVAMTQLGQVGATGATGATGPAGSPGAAFKVCMTSDQNISLATQTKINYDTVLYDTSSYWDSTNHRYTPLVAGKYRFVLNMVIDSTSGGGTTDFGVAGIWMNGVQSTIGVLPAAAAGQIRVVNVVDYDMNGSTDYVEAVGYANSGSGTTRFRGVNAGLIYNSFSGSFLRT